MDNMELEVKVLGIDKKQFIRKIEKLGAKFKFDTLQQIYTYDLPTMYGRFLDNLMLINEPQNQIKYEVAIDKMRLLFFEIDNIFSKKDEEELKKISGFNSLEKILDKKNFLEILNKKQFKQFLSKFKNNENKWLRLRKTNDKTTLTVKHILKEKEDSEIQQLKENEIEVSSFEEANKFLEALGFSNKCILEKKRTTYSYKNHNIEIDTWPNLPTFFELEGKDEEDIENILNDLGYSIKDDNVVSCIVGQIYKKFGLPEPQNLRTLKFDDKL